MKTINFTKKLSLNKKTVVNLENDELKQVHGGIGLSVRWSNCLECSGSQCQTICTSMPCCY